MTDDTAPYTVAISTTGPCDPQYVLELAAAHPEIIRALNHFTRHHEALEYPAEGHQLLGYLESAASRLPQLLDQIASWYEREAAAGKLRVTAGDWEGIPGMAAVAIRMRADAARMTAEQLEADLKSIAAVTSTLAPAETGDDG
jgi:hypothetical protein